MRSLLLLSISFFTFYANASTIECAGETDKYNISVHAKSLEGLIGEEVLSEYSFELMGRDSSTPSVGGKFQARSLVYGRGIVGGALSTEGVVVRLVFDGSRAVILYELSNSNQPDQGTLSCSESE